jgi:predicted RNA-binding Zn-ribbon protein involved in translation (DUF1610 family)
MCLEAVGVNWRVTRPTALFDEAFGTIIASLGDYPHAALSAERPKTQSTRMLKAVCPSCGYIIRLSKTTFEATTIRCDECEEAFVLDA